MNYWTILKEAGSEWIGDRAMRLSAAVSYYMIFSLPALLLIAISIMALVMGAGRAQEEVVSGLSNYVGPAAAGTVASAVANIQQQGSGIVALITGGIVLLISASTVFGELQASMNTIWDVEARSEGAWGIVRKRLIMFAMVGLIAALMLASVIFTSVFTAALNYMGGLGGWWWVWQVVNFVGTIIVQTVLFALLFKFLPDVQVRWRHVWFGAFITAVLFAIGKWAIGLYLGRSGMASTYGAAGSILLLMAWVYYSCLIFFYGAELTQVWAARQGEEIQPTEHARRTE